MKLKLSICLLALFACSTVSAAQLTDQLETFRGTDYNGPGPQRGWVPLRSLYSRPNFQQSLQIADRVHQWVLLRYGHLLPERTYSIEKRTEVALVTERTDSESYYFHFKSGVFVSVHYPTGRVFTLQIGLAGQEEDRLDELYPTPLPESVLEAVANELITLTGVRRPGLDFVMTHTKAHGLKRNVHMKGCLPGSAFYVGPGFEGIFHESTGLPVYVRFSYDIFSHEPAFMPMMSREEAYALAIPRIQQHVPWPAYRVLVQPPKYANPDYRQRQITRSPRHSALIASGTRCLVTTVVVVPVTEDDVITQWVAITFDSQTRELLTVYIQPPGEFGTSAKRVENNLKHNQMIALPNMQLQIPVQPAPGAEKPSEADALNVLVRQGRITFSAQLDAKNRVLWIEGKPYQSTRAFTRSLQMLFDKTN